MTRYRIIEHTFGDKKQYCIELKRFFGWNKLGTWPIDGGRFITSYWYSPEAAEMYARDYILRKEREKNPLIVAEGSV